MPQRLKRTLKGEAKVTIIRSKEHGQDHTISIESRDANRRAVICEVRMSPEDFANAITGWARQPGVLYVNLDYDPEGGPINDA